MEELKGKSYYHCCIRAPCYYPLCAKKTNEPGFYSPRLIGAEAFQY